MGSGASKALRPKQGRRPFDSQRNWCHPEARGTATLAAEERTHVSQDGVSRIEHDLERPDAKETDCETSGKPSCAPQSPQNFSDGFSAALHRAIGHQDVDRRVGVPDIKVRIERLERLRIVANRS